ncbi:MAG: tRNA pseudouridine(38-40) synthase TruA [Atopobiaceae bacterium]|nr:tRNA pseudouridine(38-40) synthase TruA [Atopobiaceae bacterium]
MRAEGGCRMIAAQLVIKLGYRGADFAGFAAQPTQRTVAGELDTALTTFLRREVDLTCAGRTDAGVHAIAQYVSRPGPEEELGIPRHRLLTGLTALVPDDVSILDAFRADAGFSARFDAISRSYRYRISAGSVRPVMGWDHAWWFRDPLVADVMDEAARLLEGEHDCVSFCKASSAELILSDGRSTSRNVISARVSLEMEMGEERICLDIRGNAFLHSMVRTIAGTLVEVGRGKRSPGWVVDVLEAKDRRAAGVTAPAKGLVLQDVEYPEGALGPWNPDPSLSDTHKR